MVYSRQMLNQLSYRGSSAGLGQITPTQGQASQPEDQVTCFTDSCMYVPSQHCIAIQRPVPGTCRPVFHTPEMCAALLKTALPLLPPVTIIRLHMRHRHERNNICTSLDISGWYLSNSLMCSCGFFIPSSSTAFTCVVE